MGRRLAKKYFERNTMNPARSMPELTTERAIGLAKIPSISILRKYFGVLFVSGECNARNFIELRTSQILLEINRVKRRVE